MTKLNRTWTVQPHGDLTPVGDGIWTVEGSIVMPLGRFPRRMTVIGLDGGGIAVWSPIALDAARMARLDALGEVRFLVVPNRAHRLDLAAWTQRYPAATVIAPPGAKDAVAEAAPVDATGDVIGDPDLALMLVPGLKEGEFALIVSRGDGRTLVLNDILSNVRHPRGIGANIMARLFRFGVDRPRTAWPVRRTFVADPAAVAAQFRAWANIADLRRVIVSHGDIIDVAPAAALERAAADY